MKITAIRSVVVNAEMRNWVFVRVDTDQPGLYGWGEATLEWKTRAIVGAIEDLTPLMLCSKHRRCWWALATLYWNGFEDPAAERQRVMDLHPPRRIGRPEEVAMTAVFLASDEAPFINAACIVIDGGRSVLYHE